MKFSSRKDILFSVIIIGIVLLLLSIGLYDIFDGELNSHKFYTFFLVLGVASFLLWMYFGTHYKLSPEGLMYQCGPMRGKIGYDRIREIEKGRTLWVGFRPATARKGLVVKFDRFNEIYISPKTNDTFIEKILEWNGAIKIVE